jgi:hypothetical protein
VGGFIYKNIAAVAQQDWNDRFEGLSVLSMATQRHLIESYLKQAETTPSQNQYEENFRVKLVRRLHDNEKSQGEITMHATGPVTKQPPRMTSLSVPIDRRSGTSGASSPLVGVSQNDVFSATYDPTIDRAQRAQINPVEVQSGVVGSSGVKASEKLSGKKILEMWNEVSHSFQGDLGSSIVLIGPTGAGKSTTIGLLKNAELELRYKVYSDGEHYGELLTTSEVKAMRPRPKTTPIYRYKNPSPDLPPIGDARISKTTACHVYGFEDQFLIDTGGTEDTRGMEIALVNAFSAYAAVKHSKESAFVVCFNYKDIDKRAENFFKTMRFMKEFLPIDQVSNSISILVTNVMEAGLAGEAPTRGDSGTVIAELLNINKDFLSQAEVETDDVVKERLLEKVALIQYLLRENGSFIRAVTLPMDGDEAEELRTHVKGLQKRNFQEGSALEINVPFSVGDRAGVLTAFAEYVAPSIDILKNHTETTRHLRQIERTVAQQTSDIETIEQTIATIAERLEKKKTDSGVSVATEADLQLLLKQVSDELETLVAKEAELNTVIAASKAERTRLENSTERVSELKHSIIAEAAEEITKEELWIGQNGAIFCKLTGEVAEQAGKVTAAALQKGDHVGEGASGIAAGVGTAVSTIFKTASDIKTSTPEKVPFRQYVTLTLPNRPHLVDIQYGDGIWENATPVDQKTDTFSVTLINKELKKRNTHVELFVMEKESTKAITDCRDLTRTIAQTETTLRETVLARRQVLADKKHTLDVLITAWRDGAIDTDLELAKLEKQREALTALTTKQTQCAEQVAQLESHIDVAIAPQYQALDNIRQNVHMNVEENLTVREFLAVYEGFANQTAV